MSVLIDNGVRRNPRSDELTMLVSKTVMTGPELKVVICGSLVNNEFTKWTACQQI